MIRGSTSVAKLCSEGETFSGSNSGDGDDDAEVVVNGLSRLVALELAIILDVVLVSDVVETGEGEEIREL